MMIKKATSCALFAGFLAISLFSCTGCEERTQEYQEQVSPQSVDEQLIEMHRKNVAVENDRIEEFLPSLNWKGVSSDTGLRYWITEHGNGKPIFEGDRISCEYEMKFLDGSVAYSSETNGLMTFTVGQDNVVSGLHEAAQLMNVGDRAELVLPSRLAFGFTGDQVKIPGNAPLWISIYIKELAQ